MTYDKIYRQSGSSQFRTLGGDSHSGTTGLGQTTGMTRQFGQSGATLSLFTSRMPAVNCFDASGGAASDITAFNSQVLPGDIVTVWAYPNGANGILTFAAGGNMTIGGSGRLVLRANDAVIFSANNLTDKYQPVGLAIADLVAASIPTAGYFEQGEFVRNTAPVLSGGKVLTGWTRLTTGVAHVLNTDWAPAYVPNS